MHARALVVVAAIAAVSCRKKSADPVPAPQPSATPSATVAAAPASHLPALHVERFVAARPKGEGIELAAIARDRTVLLATLDAELRPVDTKVLAREVDATEPSEIALVGGGAVVVVGRIGDTRGGFLLREGKPSTPIGLDRCLVDGGVAWLDRTGGDARVKLVRGELELTSGKVEAAPESEVRVACGPEQVVVSVRDGEHLALASLALDAASFAAPKAIEVEREGELEDELRDRVILPRAGRSVAIVRIGTEAISFREVDPAKPSSWVKVAAAKGGSAGDARLSEDADLLEAVASDVAGGKAWILSSEPAKGACGDGDPPRRLVLRELSPANGAVTATARPVVELPCGSDAVRTNLVAERTRATMWWTEPVDGKTCKQPGLTASAVVTASSDKPGAKRAPIVAEGLARVDGERFVAVIRPGGCVPWAAPENGAVVWVRP